MGIVAISRLFHGSDLPTQRSRSHGGLLPFFRMEKNMRRRDLRRIFLASCLAFALPACSPVTHSAKSEGSPGGGGANAGATGSEVPAPTPMAATPLPIKGRRFDVFLDLCGYLSYRPQDDGLAKCTAAILYMPISVEFDGAYTFLLKTSGAANLDAPGTVGEIHVKWLGTSSSVAPGLVTYDIEARGIRAPATVQQETGIVRFYEIFSAARQLSVAVLDDGREILFVGSVQVLMPK